MLKKYLGLTLIALLTIHSQTSAFYLYKTWENKYVTNANGTKKSFRLSWPECSGAGDVTLFRVDGLPCPGFAEQWTVSGIHSLCSIPSDDEINGHYLSPRILGQDMWMRCRDISYLIVKE